MEEVYFRIRQGTEGIVENERLTAGLDDETADLLLDWGIALVTDIAVDTEGLNDAVAREMMRPRLKASRRLLRYVNNWLLKSANWEPAEEGKRLAKIYEQATIAYGKDDKKDEEAVDPQLEDYFNQVAELEGDTKELVGGLRQLIEGTVQGIEND